MTKLFSKSNFPQAVELQKKVDQCRYIVGLDLHKRTTAITIFDRRSDEQKPIFQRKRVKNEEVLEIIARYSGLKVVISEAAYGWKLMADALKLVADVDFIIFDARKTSAWISMSGIKNDKVDSEMLAYACLHGGGARLAVFQSSQSLKNQEQFKFANFRDHLVKQRTKVKNQLKALRRGYEENPYTGKANIKSALVKTMENDLLDEFNFLTKKIKAAEETIETINSNDQVTALLKTIPGIGEITAFALRSKVDDFSRFEDPRHFCSYFGLAIRQHQSGDHFMKGKITKTGNSLVRMLVIQGAHSVRIHHPEYFSLFFPTLSKTALHTKEKNKLVVAVARKILTFAFHCWKNGTEFDIDAYKAMRETQSSTNTSEKSGKDAHCVGISKSC